MMISFSTFAPTIVVHTRPQDEFIQAGKGGGIGWRSYRTHFPSTNSGCSTTFLCWGDFVRRSGSRSHLTGSLVRAIPHCATAEDVSHCGTFLSFRSVQNSP
jgi:hypothetical protein